MAVVLPAFVGAAALGVGLEAQGAIEVGTVHLAVLDEDIAAIAGDLAPDDHAAVAVLHRAAADDKVLRGDGHATPVVVAAGLDGDAVVARVEDAVLAAGGQALITADHGNCEQMRNADGSPHTAHTTNLVHLIYVGDDHEGVTLEDGKLADLAPSLLDLLGVEKPEQMSGQSLIGRS